MSTWDDKPNDYEHACAIIEGLRLYIKDLQINSPAQAALDEIERLRAALQRLDDENERLVAWASENERLRVALQAIVEIDWETLRTEIERLHVDNQWLQAENERLRTHFLIAEQGVCEDCAEIVAKEHALADQGKG